MFTSAAFLAYVPTFFAIETTSRICTYVLGPWILQIGEYEETIGTCIVFSENGELQHRRKNNLLFA